MAATGGTTTFGVFTVTDTKLVTDWRQLEKDYGKEECFNCGVVAFMLYRIRRSRNGAESVHPKCCHCGQEKQAVDFRLNKIRALRTQETVLKLRQAASLSWATSLPAEVPHLVLERGLFNV